MTSTFVGVAAVLALAGGASAGDIFLDGDTPATGSDLGTMPLVTSFGTITFMGELRADPSDPDFIAAGASGNVFDIDNSSTASLRFDFDVESITFIYGGNVGVFDIEARDIDGNPVDSFFQADTDDGQPAGPITLSGRGIRELFWQDAPFSFAAIDNVDITVPAPGAAGLMALGGVALVARRRR